jgi:hypothetical protein
MATIDPSIAMGYKPIQIENPLNQLAAYSQIQGAQQTQQLNALQMQKAQQELNAQSKLGSAYSRATDRATGKIDYNRLIGSLAEDESSATAIPGVVAARKTEEQAAETLKSTKLDTLAKQRDKSREGALSLKRNPSDNNFKAYLEDNVLDGLITQAQADEEWGRISLMDLKQRNEYVKTIALKAENYFSQQETERANAAREANAAEQLGVSKGNLGVARGNLSLAERRLAADLDPNIIRSKAESTELGKLAAGQSPLAPKVIAADAGKNLVGDVATQMGNSYLKLYESSGIKSTSRGAAANLAASSQSSMLGQIGGGILGTENQSERDFIKSQRPILVQGIVKATGMTASQINSNVELKNLLDAATDPDKGYETNAKNLNLINRRFGTGTNIMPEKPTAATQSGANTVITSDGKTYTFPTPAAAAQFKQAISKIQ